MMGLIKKNRRTETHEGTAGGATCGSSRSDGALCRGRGPCAGAPIGLLRQMLNTES